MEISIGVSRRRLFMKFGEEDVIELRNEVKKAVHANIETSKTVLALADKMDILTNSLAEISNLLISYLSGTTPPRTIPIESHQLIVKGLLIGFIVILAVSVGVIQLIPAMMTFATN
jgi:hypothetical protein